MKSFCRGVQGGRFLQKESPLAAGGKSDGAKDLHGLSLILTFYWS